MDILQSVSRQTSNEINHDFNAMVLKGTDPLQETPRTEAAMCHLEGLSVDTLQTNLHLAKSDLSQFFCTQWDQCPRRSVPHENGDSFRQ